MKDEKIDNSVVMRLVKLQPITTPKHLMQKNPTKRPGDFDPNSYFTVFTHLSMKSGYTLDYVYLFMDGFGGNPCLYARRLNGKPLVSLSEHRNCGEKKNLLSFLIADGTLDGFFQLAIFRHLAGQFYLYWHANYNDVKIVSSSEEMEAIITEVNVEDFGAKFTDLQVTALRAISPEPTVELHDNGAVVSYCLFTKWGGLVRLKETFSKEPPHHLIGRNILDKVKYDCQVCY